MSEPVKTTTREQAVEDILAAVTEAADAMVKNQRGAQMMASTPEGRERLLATKAEFARWIPMLRTATKALASADLAVTKALKGRRWGFRA